MAYYETDPTVLAWFDRALSHGSSYVRMAALVLLGDVDSAHRDSWLRRAQSDLVAEVVATAVLTEAFVTVAHSVSADLFESDFAESLERGDLIWEWEYDVVVAHDVVVQLGRRTTWVAIEDDALARRLALQKAYCGKESEMPSATAIIVGKRFVNQYTRSPRSMAEASWWMRRGRPRYRE